MRGRAYATGQIPLVGQTLLVLHLLLVEEALLRSPRTETLLHGQRIALLGAGSVGRWTRLLMLLLLLVGSLESLLVLHVPLLVGFSTIHTALILLALLRHLLHLVGHIGHLELGGRGVNETGFSGNINYMFFL